MNEAIEQNSAILNGHEHTKMGGVPVKANPKLGLRWHYTGLQQLYFVTWKFEEPINWGSHKVTELADYVWLLVPYVHPEKPVEDLQLASDETIREITKEEALEIIEMRKPEGLFLQIESDNSWTAIDNSTGDTWTENFEEKETAIDWLNGKFQVV
jgi:hypothetical protein